MASTRPNSDSVLIEKPSSGNTANVPIERHRHGEHRDQRRAPVLQEQEHDEDDEHHALRPSVFRISLMPSETGSVVSSV